MPNHIFSDINGYAPANDKFIRKLVSAGFIPSGGFTPWTLRSGHTNGLSTFTTTMGVITRAHRCATHGWAYTHMAFATSFPEFDVAVIQIANLTDGSIAGLTDQTYLAGGHTDLSIITLF